jgi:hypothetical protein
MLMQSRREPVESHADAFRILKMGQVVHLLEGVMVVDVQVPPVPRSLQNYVGVEDSSSADMDSF